MKHFCSKEYKNLPYLLAIRNVSKKPLHCTTGKNDSQDIEYPDKFILIIALKITFKTLMPKSIVPKTPNDSHFFNENHCA